MAMPAMLWVVFWSSMMASAAWFGDVSRTIAPDRESKSNEPAN
jgi:hypothetical protein